MTNQTPNNQPVSDEIDLGQLLQLIKKGLHNLGNFFLRLFIYLKNNMLKLIGLAVLGLVISYGLNQIISKKLKTDIIVKPNFDSKNYLYEVVDELSANMKSKNIDFLEKLGLSNEDIEGFQVEVMAIEDTEKKSDDAVLNDMKYLELLQNFENESFVVDIIRSELSEKSVINHKIVFTYNDAVKGPQTVEKLMNYINTNEYFVNLKKVHANNANSRIQQNTALILQIDKLVENYSKALLAEKQKSGTGVVYMEKENTLNIPSLLEMKDKLLKEIEEKRIETAQQTEVLSIINFGKTQEVRETFFKQTYFFIPALLIFGFFFLSFFRYLNRKSKEIQQCPRQN